MKTIKELRNNYLVEVSTFSKLDSKVAAGYPSDKKIPMVLILKRKAIRIYPDNQKVALYYIEALDKYVTIPFGDGVPTISEGIGKAAISAYKAMRTNRTLRNVSKLRTQSNLNIKKDKMRFAKDVLAGRASYKEKLSGTRENNISNVNNIGSDIVTPGRGSTYQFGQIKPIISPEKYSVSQHDPLSRSPSSIQKFYRLQSTAAITPNQMYESLQNIKETKKEETIVLNEENVIVDSSIAQNLLHLYESLNKKNKEKMLKKLCENKNTFKKIVDFAFKNRN